MSFHEATSVYGATSNSLSGGTNQRHADKNTHNIDKDIDEMFDHFPLKK